MGQNQRRRYVSSSSPGDSIGGEVAVYECRVMLLQNVARIERLWGDASTGLWGNNPHSPHEIHCQGVIVHETVVMSVADYAADGYGVSNIGYVGPATSQVMYIR